MMLVFDRNFDPRHGEAVAVAPGVRRVTATNEGPFTFRGTNTFLIGASDVTVLDPGPDDPMHLEAILAAVGDGRVERILLSHSHRDHAAGAMPLQERTGAPVLAGIARRVSPKSGEPRLGSEPQSGFAPDRVLADAELIEGNGYRLEAIATPGHAADHLAFALSGTRVLFSGDHVMGWSTSVVAPPDGSMADYVASLDRLLARSEDVYLPAHGGVIADAATYVRRLRTHRLEREAAILRALRQGWTTIPEIVAKVYGELDPRLGGAAGLSTLAHLEDLIARGLVADECTTDATRYRLAVPAAGSG
jgi:glyoxylase-like metal-dependent hydrolase (beta-lactamase superfamily II)